MNRLLSLGILLVFAACNTQPKTVQVKEETAIPGTTIKAGCSGMAATHACCPEAKSCEFQVVSVDSVQKNPEKYFDKTIALKGRVVHTCKVSGKKMFLAGSDEQQLIRVNAGGNISRFDESLQGEIVIAVGELTPLTDNGEKNDSTGKATCITENKSKQYVLACSTFEVQGKK